MPMRIHQMHAFRMLHALQIVYMRGASSITSLTWHTYFMYGIQSAILCIRYVTIARNTHGCLTAADMAGRLRVAAAACISDKRRGSGTQANSCTKGKPGGGDDGAAAPKHRMRLVPSDAGYIYIYSGPILQDLGKNKTTRTRNHLLGFG